MKVTLIAISLGLLGCSSGDLDTQLIHASKEGNGPNVSALLARGATVTAQDEDGWTPLMWAAAHGDEASVGALLDAGADIRVTTRTERQSPLTLAAKWNRVGVVALLLRRGAAVQARDAIGWTALMWASLQGRTDAQFYHPLLTGMLFPMF